MSRSIHRVPLSRPGATQRVVGLLDTLANDRLDRIARMATRVFGVRAAALAVGTGSRITGFSAIGVPSHAVNDVKAFCRGALAEGVAWSTADARLHPTLARGPLVDPSPRYRMVAVQPLDAPVAQRTAVLVLFDPRVMAFSESDRQALCDLAHWAQSELEVAALGQELALRRA